MRLNPNQIASRVRGVTSNLSINGRLPDDDQIFLILEKSGILDRIERFLNLPTRDKADVVPAPVAEEEPSGKKIEDLAAARDEILVGLYERARAGDAQSARAFADISAENAPQDRFNINLHVVPYTISDPSLKSIALQAEPQTADQMLDGLALRLEIDEGPHDLRDLLRQFRGGFMKWAEEAYAPKDAV